MYKRQLQQNWLVRLHPVAEVGLGLLLVVGGAWLSVVAAVAAVAVLLIYTWLIWRALQGPVATSCACFGAPTVVSARLLVRNVWLLILAVGSVAIAVMDGRSPAVRLVDAGPPALAWILVVAAAVATTLLVVHSDAAPVSYTHLDVYKRE